MEKGMQRLRWHQSSENFVESTFGATPHLVRGQQVISLAQMPI
jgi:hypothetical protein